MTVRTLFGEREINPSADLDETTLAAIAEMPGGRYFRARDTAELAGIYSILDELEPAESDAAGFRPVSELFYSYSTDAGASFSPGVAVSPPFDCMNISCGPPSVSAPSSSATRST